MELTREWDRFEALAPALVLHNQSNCRNIEERRQFLAGEQQLHGLYAYFVQILASRRFDTFYDLHGGLRGWIFTDTRP